MSKADGMNGQWLGTYTDGESRGTVIVNIDEHELNYHGVAYLLNEDESLPISGASFMTPNKDGEFRLRTDPIEVIDRASGNIVPWGIVSEKYPNVTFPRYADVRGSWAKDSLTLSWDTNVGTAGNCVLPRSKAAKPSELEAVEQSWATYRQHVSRLIPKRYLFRGQNSPWRLRTSFHRTGRADLHRFLNEDIPALHRQLSAKTRHVFNRAIPDENGAFFNLVQHHGYPTPLLDWTYSPYVAAFFAYREIQNETAEAASAEKVRILVFDQEQWKKDFVQFYVLIPPGLHFSICEFIAIENERMIPQQAASTITNVDDIEAYIKSKESDTKKYLWAIDLPVRERRDVIRELSYMGITAGSLFPGLDGTCEELKERNFEI